MKKLLTVAMLMSLALSAMAGSVSMQEEVAPEENMQQEQVPGSANEMGEPQKMEDSSMDSSEISSPEASETPSEDMPQAEEMPSDEEKEKEEMNQ
jgi:hypothetical protein